MIKEKPYQWLIPNKIIWNFRPIFFCPWQWGGLNGLLSLNRGDSFGWTFFCSTLYWRGPYKQEYSRRLPLWFFLPYTGRAKGNHTRQHHPTKKRAVQGKTIHFHSYDQAQMTICQYLIIPLTSAFWGLFFGTSDTFSAETLGTSFGDTFAGFEERILSKRPSSVRKAVLHM